MLTCTYVNNAKYLHVRIGVMLNPYMYINEYAECILVHLCE
jgi:hypothetical protein